MSRVDFAQVRRDHPLLDVLSRLGLATGDSGQDFTISCPRPGHRDSTPSCVIHPDTNRWHCFGCSTGGDVLDLVRAVTGVTSLAAAAAILTDPGRITPHAGHTVPIDHSVSVVVSRAERPDLTRTPLPRVHAANAAAWTYYTQTRHAATARTYLHARGLDLTALEHHTRAPLAGYAPAAPTALTDHLQQQGFTADELVDAGWATRQPDGALHDRYRRRVLLPVRDEPGNVLGVYGRDITGRATHKYVNTGHTIAFHKGHILYRPTTHHLDPHATVIVCEGSLDALAIAAHAATAGTSRYFAPISPSGTALTDHQIRQILALHPAPPLICADGDPPGHAAALTWIQKITHAGRETVATLLPHNHDPASWLQQHGDNGLSAFIRKGCLHPTGYDLRPTHAGAVLAEHLTSTAIADPSSTAMAALPDIVATLGRYGAMLQGPAAAHRFAHAASHALADHELGTDSAITGLLLAAIRDAQIEIRARDVQADTRAGRPLPVRSIA